MTTAPVFDIPENKRCTARLRAALSAQRNPTTKKRKNHALCSLQGDTKPFDQTTRRGPERLSTT